MQEYPIITIGGLYIDEFDFTRATDRVYIISIGVGYYFPLDIASR
jgi:hypothetical protein